MQITFSYSPRVSTPNPIKIHAILTAVEGKQNIHISGEAGYTRSFDGSCGRTNCTIAPIQRNLNSAENPPDLCHNKIRILNRFTASKMLSVTWKQMHSLTRQFPTEPVPTSGSHTQAPYLPQSHVRSAQSMLHQPQFQSKIIA